MNKRNVAVSSLPYFSIVIPAYNEEAHIGQCLTSIYQSDYDKSKYEVIVVDNGSKDRSYDIAVSLGRAKVLELPEANVGAVRNFGANQAQGEILIFIDADCLLDIDWLNRAEKLSQDYPDFACGGGVKLPNNATWIEKSWLLENKGQPTLPKNLIGASIMLPKKLFFEVNGFNELITSGEDTDLHHRLGSKNIPVLIDHSLNITHLGNAKTYINFIRRQIWHSENYARNLKSSLVDPIFNLIFIYTTLSTFSFIFLIINHKILLVTISASAIIPMFFSIKRIKRSKDISHFYNLHKIYILDLMYVSGRSLGLLKGLYTALKRSRMIKKP